MSNKYCLNCGSEIPAGLKYCPVCGAPAPKDQASAPSQKLFDVPDLPVEEDVPPLDIDRDEDEQTQQLDLDIPAPKKKPVSDNAIHLDEPKVSSPVHSSSDNGNPEKKKKFSVFIEDDDDDYDDEEDLNEKHHSHTGLIVFLILLAAVIAALLFMFMNHRGPFAAKSSPVSVSDQTPEVTETATPEVTAAPQAAEQTQADEGSIGTAVVVLDSVNVRDQPSLNGNLVRTVKQGESLPVYETTEADGYTWYRISENEWAATDGTWFDYTPNN